MRGRMRWPHFLPSCFSLLPESMFTPLTEMYQRHLTLANHVLPLRMYRPGLSSLACIILCLGNRPSLRAMFIQGALFSVDTFFLVSGFLLSYVLLPKLEKGSFAPGAFIKKTYIHRYIRLTPTLVMVTLLQWKILPRLGQGPAWWPIAILQEGRCQR